ncbi:hypothetical protein [Sphingomonas montana]|uniref:hypothetical protein n=1 Tax=Sphingomonas montana TaxID=1843236 RepID=UPI00096E025E|nr:hypothetical protein [Sphingomonas montana]
MHSISAIIAVFDDETLAEAAVDRLSDLLASRAAITVAGVDRADCVLPINLYKVDQRVRIWGRPSGLWQRQWPIFADGVSLPSPGSGATFVLGYMASAVIAALDGWVSATGAEVFGSALEGIGVPADDATMAQASLLAGKIIVMTNARIDNGVLLPAIAGAVAIRLYDAVSAAPAMPSADQAFHVEMHCQT